VTAAEGSIERGGDGVGAVPDNRGGTVRAAVALTFATAAAGGEAGVVVAVAGAGAFLD